MSLWGCDGKERAALSFSPPPPPPPLPLATPLLLGLRPAGERRSGGGGVLPVGLHLGLVVELANAAAAEAPMGELKLEIVSDLRCFGEGLLILLAAGDEEEAAVLLLVLLRARALRTELDPGEMGMGDTGDGEENRAVVGCEEEKGESRSGRHLGEGLTGALLLAAAPLVEVPNGERPPPADRGSF